MDAMGAIVVAMLALIWAMVLLIGSLVSIVKVLRLKLAWTHSWGRVPPIRIGEIGALPC
ncbi:hypothetical protein [Vitiosangium sp. GDMCC 1.1324]|uniref:hypothetical protein n=1 Tax=Vitiosangium sp. (strain GDMCC 1.1324) TaxID=2138576 RepID=UPI00130E8656|nr:hypothetical protein [Vitiosangium sp. GDMCC 1.1324]